jgi:L-asparaginase II
MANPVLVEIVRGDVVESRHRGAACVVDADGSVVLALGGVEGPVYPRSAVKALQALPVVESGVADQMALTDAEIALACASHAGEGPHVATAAAMLRKARRDETSLECGVHWPLSEDAARTLAAHGGKPTALHNNCSGKHAGFVCLACSIGADPKGYVNSEHRVQRMVRAALEDVTGAPHTEAARAIDGCSIPTYAVPLQALALGFARFGAGTGLSEDRRRAARRIRQAVAAHPFMVAGTGRFDTKLMQALGLRAFVKAGAEGVHCAALPELGLGLAVKADDGTKRGAEVMLAALIRRFLPLTSEERLVVDAWTRRDVTNWKGRVVGEIRAADPLAGDDQAAVARVRVVRPDPSS